MVQWLQRTPKSLWLIEADPHRRRVHFITTTYLHFSSYFNGLGRLAKLATSSMSYNPIVVTLSSLKPFFFNGLK